MFLRPAVKQADISSRDRHKYDPLQSNQMHQMKLLLFFLEAYMRVRADGWLQRCRLCDSVLRCPMMMTMTTCRTERRRSISKRALSY